MELLAALLASLLIGGTRGDAADDTVAFTNGAKVFTAQADGSGIELRASSPRAVADVAFDRLGTLYASEFGARPGCDVYAAGGMKPTLRFKDVRAQVRGEIGLCDITFDPRGGLLFDVSSKAAPFGRNRVWHLDPRSGRIKPIAFGIHPAFAPDGKRLVVALPRVDHWTLLLGRPEQPSSFKPTVPPETSNASVAYMHPAFSRDGTQIAVIRESASGVDRSRRPVVGDLLIGRPGGPFRSIFRVSDGRRLGQVAWLSDGRTLLVNVFDRRRSSIGDVQRLPVRGGKPQRILQDVTAFAVHAG